MRILTFVTLLFVSSVLFSQDEYSIYTIGFYNVENLFDTLDTKDKDDYEFLPGGLYKWTGKRFIEKSGRIAEIIARMGADKANTAPTVVGLSEIENKSVIEHLVNCSALKDYDYGVCHIESPDKRGVDVGLIYRKGQVEVRKYYAHELWIENAYEGFATRNQLVVEATIEGEDIAFIVNHWPSRRAGSRYRKEAAALNRAIIDSLREITPGLHCITMGDFNDDPTDKSISKVLGAVGKAEKLTEKNYLYNPMYKMFKKGLGSLAYRDAWSLFDQIIISKELKENREGLFFYDASICDFSELVSKSGRYKGYPFRAYAGGSYRGGYSDHFPVVIYLLKQQNK